MGPTHVKISHPDLLHNFKLIKKKIGRHVKLMAVVKANAYGHGLIEVARTLEKNNVDYFGVAFPQEGVQLRQAGISNPILVMGAHLDSDLEMQVNHQLDITITRIDQLKQLNTYCNEKKKTARIHFKVNTGMNRIGLDEKDLFQAYKLALNYKFISIAGVYSHLSSSDEEDQSYTQSQIQRFKKIRDTLYKPQHTVLFHVANSAGTIQSSDYWFDMVRTGITLYGNPSNPEFKIDKDFKEVMSFHTKIMLIREAAKNEPISYSRRFYTKEKTKIAVLPVGYADGYNRALTNKGSVLINGKRFPVVGTVCMNHILVNIGERSKFDIGQDVVLFGRQGKEHISIAEIAAQLNTIPYEITCSVSALVERIHQY